MTASGSWAALGVENTTHVSGWASETTTASRVRKARDNLRLLEKKCESTSLKSSSACGNLERDIGTTINPNLQEAEALPRSSSTEIQKQADPGARTRNIQCGLSCMAEADAMLDEPNMPRKAQTCNARDALRRSPQTLGVLEVPALWRNVATSATVTPTKPASSTWPAASRQVWQKQQRPLLVLAGAGRKGSFLSQPQPENTGELWKRIC